MSITGSSVSLDNNTPNDDVSILYIDISTPDFPGINVNPTDGEPLDQRIVLTPESHPHLRLEECMISVPKVNPGDTVFWHCDVVHAVENEHKGSGDSAGKHFLSLLS